jgi:hypothetical protein
MKTANAIGASLVLFLVSSTAGSAQLGDLVSGVLQTVTGQEQITVDVPGVATINVGDEGGSAGTGAGVGVSVLGGSTNTGLNVGTLAGVNLGLPGGDSPDPGTLIDERPVTEHPGWIGQDPVSSTSELPVVGGQLPLIGTLPAAGNRNGGNQHLLGERSDGPVLDGTMSSRMRTLLRVLDNRLWSSLADGDSLCLTGFGAARVTGWLRSGDLEHLDDVVAHYGSDIEVLQRLIANCPSNRQVIGRDDIESIIGLDVRDGRQILFML